MGIKKNDGLDNQKENMEFLKDAKEKKTSLKLDVNIVVKISQKHKEILDDYFKNSKGISLSGGIRQLIFDFMKNNNLI